MFCLLWDLHVYSSKKGSWISMNQVDRDVFTPVYFFMMNWGAFPAGQRQPHWDDPWPTKFQEMLDCLLLLESWITILMILNVHSNPWKQEYSNMWKTMAQETRQAWVQNSKKWKKTTPNYGFPTQWLPHAIPPHPIISPHELPPRTWWTHHARGPPVETTVESKDFPTV